MSVDDRPEYSADIDDSSWATLTLPRGRDFFFPTKYWLRRRVELPDGTDLTQLTLTVGTIQDVYEVHVNSQLIGASGSFDSFEKARIPRPRTFGIPAPASRKNPLQIALRVRSALFAHPVWRLADTGPYLLTYPAQAPAGEGRRQLERQWVAVSFHLVFGAIFGVIGILSLVGWLGERDRRELLWFVLVCFGRAFAAVYLVTRLVADSQPFDHRGMSWEFVFGHFDKPLFTEFVFAALGVRSWKLRLALWIGWCVAPLSLLTDGFGFSLLATGALAYLWVAGLSLAVIVPDWWRLMRLGARAEEHALHGVLFLSALSQFTSWLTLHLINLQAISTHTFGEGYDSPFFVVGPYHVEYDDLFWLIVSTTILTFLFRRLAADRRERQRLASELEAARVIQRLLLEKTVLREPDLALDAVYAPALEVGGDFYYVLDEHVVVVGDVSGKGLKAAMLVSLLIGVLREAAHRAPGAVLAALNRAIAGHIDGGFVTCCCARFDAGGVVTVANAGHLAPYLNGDEVAIETGLPLGLDGEVVYAESALSLGPDASFTLLSDGVVEAENAKGELLGFERTREISGQTAAEIADAANAWGQNDDITVVTVRRKA